MALTVLGTFLKPPAVSASKPGQYLGFLETLPEVSLHVTVCNITVGTARSHQAWPPRTPIPSSQLHFHALNPRTFDHIHLFPNVFDC